MLFNNNLTHHNAYSSMNTFSCRFFASLVWYLTHDVAVCSGGGGDFGRSFCQLPPSPSYPRHDSLEEWRSVFQIQDPQYLLQRSLKILKFLIALPQLSYYMPCTTSDMKTVAAIIIYVVHVLFIYFNCYVKMKCILTYNATEDFISKCINCNTSN